MTSPRDTTILVIDDEEDTATLLCELLQRRGHRAVALLSGSRCLEYLRSGRADVVVTDIQMPGMTGIELCRELHLRHPDLLSIVVTGVADLQHADAAIRAGAYDFITKPVKWVRLESAINRALDHLAVRRAIHRAGAAVEPQEKAGG